MFQELANHNDDLKRLVEKGYCITEDHGYLVIRDIPYLDADRQCQRGAFVTNFDDVDGKKIRLKDHQIFFTGTPHELDRSPIRGLGGGTTGLVLRESPDVVVQRSFSNKLTNASGQMRDYVDFFEKVEHYSRIVCGPAKEKYGATPYTYRLIEQNPTRSVFKFRDTLSSRAQIVDLSGRFADDVVAVIGIGGTGSYVLDFLSKTPVKEIRGFDLDEYHIHTAYRSPGKVEPEDFGKKKVDVYKSRYDNFRYGVSLEAKYIDSQSGESLDGVTFAFVCVDKGTSRAGIFDVLIQRKIPFIDVGMGLNRNRGSIDGTLRATYYSVEDAQRLRNLDLAEVVDDPDDEYRLHIQVAELNALNAALAVIKFKQIRGFYCDKDVLNSLAMQVNNIKTFHEVL